MAQTTSPQRSAANTRDPDGLRVSDTDRQSVVEALGRHAGDGYITMEELEERSAHAFAAKTRADLGGLLADLPQLPGMQSPALIWAGAMPECAARKRTAACDAQGPRKDEVRKPRSRMRRLYHRCSELITVGALLTGIWLMAGGGYYWPMWVLVPLGVFTVL